MCYHTQLTKTKKELEERFDATLEQPVLFEPGEFNSFARYTRDVIAR